MSERFGGHVPGHRPELREVALGMFLGRVVTDLRLATGARVAVIDALGGDAQREVGGVPVVALEQQLGDVYGLDTLT